MKKVERYQYVAEKMGVCHRTIIRWKDAGCDIDSDLSLCQFVKDRYKCSPREAINVEENALRLLRENLELNLFEYDPTDKDRQKRISLIKSFEDRIKFRKAKVNFLSKDHSNKKNESARHLYLLKNKRNGYYKIGLSTRPRIRERTLQSEDPEICCIKHWSNCGHMEKFWHNHFSEQRIRGEWFWLTDAQVRFMVFKMKNHDA